MRPSRLYIKDFMCYDDAYIDFNEFSVALIVGKMEHNDAVSNGVGKTTVFRAIEYVLFNHADVNLENIVRDDATSCSVTLDFEVGNQEYRVTRTRTRKNSTDLTLFKRTANVGLDTESLHSIVGDRYSPLSEEKYWIDISGRRSADTEKEVAKLIKATLKSFRIFVHFMQHDFTGLTTATPEKRKLILKDALNLAVYSKLEKISKDKSSLLTKEADRINTLIEAMGDPDKDLLELSRQLVVVGQEINSRTINLEEHERILYQLTEAVSKMSDALSNLESKFSALVAQEQLLNGEKSRIETSIKEYHSKKSNVIKAAKDLLAELKDLEDVQIQLATIDYHKIDSLTELTTLNREKIAQFSLTIQNDISRCEKLKIPLPDDGECEHCRQPLTREHRKICQLKIDDELAERQRNIQHCKKEIAELNAQNNVYQQSVNSLNLQKQHLESLNTKIATKKKEMLDRRTIHDEYSALLEKFTSELGLKNKEIEQVIQDLQISEVATAKNIQKELQIQKQNIVSTNGQISLINKELTHYNSGQAVLQHTLNQKVDSKRKKIEYIKLLKELDTKLGMYPSVVQAFSSSGIPNLIIQNVLDDLQIEANNLLAQLKPGLQLSFAVEKTKGDGTETDTLDIQYNVNGKKRYYEQLSGAMQLSVTFSLKLGLSFLLQKMIGVDIKFLLLDEIDQSLDKASVDAFADIVKFFQKDFTILVITHNDRLKDKFSHAILVEQDINMISRARVVSSW